MLPSRWRFFLSLCLTTSIYTQLVASQTQAQLVGCETLGCSSTGCTLGNVTNAFLGATSFNASLPTSTSSSPTQVELTWTVGALAQSPPQTSGSSSSTKDTLFTKNFYLGYPPSLNLTTDSTGGCALFFEGIARSIPLNGSEYGSMTCQSALGTQCTSDLLTQAEGLVNTKSNTVCADLQSHMQASPPSSCLGVATVTWGSVVAKDLTSPQAISQTSCHPSVAGAGYDVALIETQTVRSEDVSSDLAPFLYSLTPVLSVFYSDSQTATTKTYLSCLKVIDAAAGSVTTTTQTSGALDLPVGRLVTKELLPLALGVILTGVLGWV
ncbi:hypothetical protein EDD37DRAFT_83160 [Exophiala viscosa]|uniref:uncharacterized protein n=1 Tax=Exophiala viscosa TaxID=2486360 RepID=UPI00218E4DF0|nr:hypothetical protein EDD37DRAFT_83160 [Exophiala viscosa]